MQHIVRHLDETFISRIGTLVGKRWDHIATPSAFAPGFLESPVFLVADHANFALAIETEYIEVDGEELTVGHVCEAEGDRRLAAAQEAGQLFALGNGELVKAIFIVRESIELTYLNEAFLKLEVDSGLVVRLESVVISVCQRGFHGGDFVINAAEAIETLPFYDSAGEWPETVELRHEFKRVLVPNGSGGAPIE